MPSQRSFIKPEREKVRRMFGEIAVRYELLNRLLTFNSDQAWRRQLGALIEAPPGARVLDVGGGTGESARAWLQEHPDTNHVIVADFTRAMLRIAQQKFASNEVVSVVCCDALELPYQSECFDVVMAVFAVRNFADLHTGLREMARVTRPGGQVAILEFCGNRVCWPAEIYRRYVVPLVGYGLTGRKYAYDYLVQSSGQFMAPQQLESALERVGLGDIVWRRLFWRVVTFISGTKPD